MGIKQYSIQFTKFAQEPLVRSNYKTAILGIEINEKLSEGKKKYSRLKDYFDIISGFAFKSVDYISEGIPLIRIGDVNNDFNPENMVYLPEDYKDDYKRFLLKKDDIIVSLTGEGKLKADLISEDDRYLLNQRVGSLRAKTNVNILFYYYLINYYALTKAQFYWWSNGKTQLNISPFDFLKIRVPLLTNNEQQKVVAEIEPIESKVANLKNKLTPHATVINKVFARDFGFSEDLYNEFGKGMTAGTQTAVDRTLRTFNVPLDEIKRSNIMRVSSRYHNTPTKELMDFLDTHPTLYVNDVVASYEKGLQPKYDPDGDIPVVKIANLKNSFIDFTEAETISQETFDLTPDKKRLKQGDIIMCNS